MSSISYRHSLAILCCALPFAASAQKSNPIPRLDNIVVTASRVAQLESEIIGDVTVIDKKELERTGQTSLAEVLAKQPGIQFSNNGGPQTATGLFLRGAGTSQTLVLVDGLRINGSTTGGTNWNAIDPGIIERVEILRGSASSLYGSDAIGGVINIITRKTGEDRPLSAWGNIGYGTHDTFKSSVGLSGATNGWDYAVSSFMASSEGFNASRPESGMFTYHPDRDGYERHGVSGSLGYTWMPGHHIGVSMLNSYVNGDFDSGQDNPLWGDFPHPAVTRTRQQVYSITSTNQITTTWQSVLRFGLTKETSDSRAGTSWNTSFDSLQRSWNWQNNFTINENHNISTLFEHLEEQIGHSADFNGTTRNTNAAGVIYRGKFNKLRTQASVRNDNISGYGSKRTGSLGLDYDLTGNWSIGAAGNTGFRAPTFTDLYYPSFPGFPPASNPNLKPEKSRNIEAHITYANDTTQLNATVYQNKIRDLIVLDTNYTPFNTGRATIKGLTLSGEHILGNTRISASADFMNPRDDKTRRQLPRRARQVFNLGVNHRMDAWDLGAEYQFVGKRYDDAPNNTRLDSYSLVSLTAAYDVTKNAGVQLRWNNVFDKNYTNAYGYNMPGSNVFVNLSFRM